jgi:hypothetical protein
VCLLQTKTFPVYKKYLRFQNEYNKVEIEFRVVQFWTEIKLVITHLISVQIALHSVQLPLFLEISSTDKTDNLTCEISHVKIIAFQLSLFCKNDHFSKTVLYIINRKIHGCFELQIFSRVEHDISLVRCAHS